MRLLISKFIITSSLMLFTVYSFAQVGGQVFEEFPVNGTTLNTYGVLDANELGVDGVIVTITDASGTISTQTTAGGGLWNDPTTNFPVRVEFTWPSHTWLESSPFGNNSLTSIQIITAANSAVNFGLHNPGNYVSDGDPDFVIPGYVNGDPLLGGTTAPFPAIYKVNNAATGSGDPAAIAMNYDNLADLSEVGATWGIGYQRSSETVFAGAFIKRHTGLGSLGTGGIYAIDANTGGATAWLDVNTLAGVNTGTDPRVTDGIALPADKDEPSVDLTAFSSVAKMSLGDVDVSMNDMKLHVMDLAGKQLLVIDIATKGLDNAYPIPDPGCSNGDYQPFGLGEFQGKIFAGVVCTGETSNSDTDISAWVYRLDGATWTPVLSNINLNYARPDNTTASNNNNWEHWADDWVQDVTNPGTWPTSAFSPILSDLSFDIDGSMILGFMDRGGHQIGAFNHQAIAGDNSTGTEGYAQGDILRAGYDGTNWTIENNGTAGGTTTAGAGNGQGPGGGEFYLGDYGRSAAAHTESVMGGIATVAGSGRLATSHLDPVLTSDFPAFAESARMMGVKWMSNTTGDHLQGVTLVPCTSCFSNSTDDDGTFSKAHGMGDLELLTDPAPLEIGNLVWNDADGDGIQDPTEAGIPGITVELLKNGSVISTAMTDAQGNYIFSNFGGGSTTGSHIYNIAQLMAGMDYVVRVPTTHMAQALSNPGAGSSVTIDSDANVNTGEADVLAADIPFSGANNHTFDFGYREPGCVAPTAPVLAVANNVCPSTTGSFSVLTPCSATSTIEYSVDGGANWMSMLPVWANGVNVMARCVDNTNDSCVSPNSPVVLAVSNPCAAECPDPNCFEITIDQN